VSKKQTNGKGRDVDVDRSAPRTGMEAAAPDEGARRLHADPEVSDKARRRRFSAEYKRKILREADACTVTGQIGALLRREGLYWSHLTTWRRQRDRGEIDGLRGNKAGSKATDRKKTAEQAKRLRRQVARLERKLKQAETIIEFQKKISELLGLSLEETTTEGAES
jgi:transposase-like protein